MFKASYINELYKLCKKRKVIVGSALTLVAVLLAAVIMYAAGEFAGILLAGRASLPILILNLLSYTLLPLFIVLVTVDMFGGEMRDKTIKLTLTRPVSRRTVFLAKAAACATYVAATLLLTLLLSLIGAVVAGHGTIAIFKIIFAYFLTLFPLCVFALFVAFLALWVRGTGGAFILSVGLFIAMLAVGTFVKPVGSFLFTSAMDWYRLFTENYVNVGKIVRELLVLLGSGLLFGGLGLYLFEQRDI